MTRLLFGAVLACAGTVAAEQQPAATASLAGRVMLEDSPTPQPVARVLVAIDASDGKGERVTVSDDEGRFVFAGLRIGRYLLRATKVGWVPSKAASLSRTPFRWLCFPVRMMARLGAQMPFAQKQSSKRVPPRATRSIPGVLLRPCP